MGLDGMHPSLQRASVVSQMVELRETVEAMRQSLSVMQSSFGSLSASVIQLPRQQAVELEEKIVPIQVQLATMGPKLQKVDEFIKNDASFLVDAVAAKGLITGIEGRVASLEGRLGVLEGQRERERNWKAIWFNIFIAVVSAVLAAVGTAIAIFTYYGITP